MSPPAGIHAESRQRNSRCNRIEPQSVRPGAPAIARDRGVEVDQGLRTFMLGVYNNMIARPGHLRPRRARHQHAGRHDRSVAGRGRHGRRRPDRRSARRSTARPLKWVVMLAPLAFIFFFSFRMDKMSAATARAMFFAFAAVMGVSLSTILARLHRRSDHAGVLHHGGGLRRPQPVRLHHASAACRAWARS